MEKASLVCMVVGMFLLALSIFGGLSSNVLPIGAIVVLLIGIFTTIPDTMS